MMKRISDLQKKMNVKASLKLNESFERIFEATNNNDYKTVTPDDGDDFYNLVKKLNTLSGAKDILNVHDDVLSISFVEDDPANDDRKNANILFWTVFPDATVYYVKNFKTGKIYSADNLSDIWDITSDGKNPNTYYAITVNNATEDDTYFFTNGDGAGYLIGGLSEDEKAYIFHSMDMQDILQTNGAAFDVAFAKNNVF